jgi:hypothetical protein
MENHGIMAGIIIVIIAIIVVAAIAITYNPTPSVSSTSTSSVPANSSHIGITNTTKVLAPGCEASSVFACTNASVYTNGQVSLSISSKSNLTFYNIHVACIPYSGSITQPKNQSSWYALSSLGTVKPYNFTGTTILPGGIENIANLQCYTPSGNSIILGQGQKYEGVVLVNYTDNSNPVSSSTQWITAGSVAFNLTASQPA